MTLEIKTNNKVANYNITMLVPTFEKGEDKALALRAYGFRGNETMFRRSESENAIVFEAFDNEGHCYTIYNDNKRRYLDKVYEDFVENAIDKALA